MSEHILIRFSVPIFHVDFSLTFPIVSSFRLLFLFTICPRRYYDAAGRIFFHVKPETSAFFGSLPSFLTSALTP